MRKFIYAFPLDFFKCHFHFVLSHASVCVAYFLFCIVLCCFLHFHLRVYCFSPSSFGYNVNYFLFPCFDFLFLFFLFLPPFSSPSFAASPFPCFLALRSQVCWYACTFFSSSHSSHQSRLKLDFSPYVFPTFPFRRFNATIFDEDCARSFRTCYENGINCSSFGFRIINVIDKFLLKL